MNQFSFSTLPARTWLFLVLLLYVAFWFIYPHEFDASDPAAYSMRAYAISQSLDFGNSDVFNQRIAVTVPVAFFYATLGVNILTTHLWPLLAALIIIVTVWLALPDDKSKIIGALLCLTSIPLLQSGIDLYPDIIASAFMASSSLILFNREKFIDGPKTWLLAPLGAVSLLFIAFLAKESAYWALPLWGLALSSDLKSANKKALLRRFYLPAFVAGLVLGVAYLVFCDVTWGDPLARIHSIQALTGQHLWSWDKTSTHKLVERLTTAPVDLLFNQYSAFAVLLAFLGIAIAPKSIKPWGQYAICCLLLYWFGSTSLTRYEPLPLVERMTLPLLPAFYVLAAFAISRLSLITEQAKSINVFVPIIVVIGFAGFPFAQYVKAWLGVEITESAAVRVVKNSVTNNPNTNYLLICSDQRTPRILSFYFGYQYPKNLRAVFAGDLSKESLKEDIKFVYVDKQRSEFLKSAYGYRHYDNEIDALHLFQAFKSDDVELLVSVKNDELRTIVQNDKPIEGQAK